MEDLRAKLDAKNEVARQRREAEAAERAGLSSRMRNRLGVKSASHRAAHDHDVESSPDVAVDPEDEARLTRSARSTASVSTSKPCRKKQRVDASETAEQTPAYEWPMIDPSSGASYTASFASGDSGSSQRTGPLRGVGNCRRLRVVWPSRGRAGVRGTSARLPGASLFVSEQNRSQTAHTRQNPDEMRADVALHLSMPPSTVRPPVAKERAIDEERTARSPSVNFDDSEDERMPRDEVAKRGGEPDLTLVEQESRADRQARVRRWNEGGVNFVNLNRAHYSAKSHPDADTASASVTSSSVMSPGDVPARICPLNPIEGIASVRDPRAPLESRPFVVVVDLPLPARIPRPAPMEGQGRSLHTAVCEQRARQESTDSTSLVAPPQAATHQDQSSAGIDTPPWAAGLRPSSTVVVRAMSEPHTWTHWDPQGTRVGSSRWSTDSRRGPTDRRAPERSATAEFLNSKPEHRVFLFDPPDPKAFLREFEAKQRAREAAEAEKAAELQAIIQQQADAFDLEFNYAAFHAERAEAAVRPTGLYPANATDRATGGAATESEARDDMDPLSIDPTAGCSVRFDVELPQLDFAYNTPALDSAVNEQQMLQLARDIQDGRTMTRFEEERAGTPVPEGTTAPCRMIAAIGEDLEYEAVLPLALVRTPPGFSDAVPKPAGEPASTSTVSRTSEGGLPHGVRRVLKRTQNASASVSVPPKDNDVAKDGDDEQNKVDEQPSNTDQSTSDENATAADEAAPRSAEASSAAPAAAGTASTTAPNEGDAPTDGHPPNASTDTDVAGEDATAAPTSSSEDASGRAEASESVLTTPGTGETSRADDVAGPSDPTASGGSGEGLGGTSIGVDEAEGSHVIRQFFAEQLFGGSLAALRKKREAACLHAAAKRAEVHEQRARLAEAESQLAEALAAVDSTHRQVIEAEETVDACMRQTLSAAKALLDKAKE